jgi:hypothetical protein
MPVRGPEQWVVTAVSGAHADLVAVDARPFFAPTDPWFEAPTGEMCLRPAARARALSGSLLPHRIDHWSAAMDALAGAGAPDADAMIDTNEAAFRAQLLRAARLLPEWLAARTLRLVLPDFALAEGGASLAADQQRIERANARLAAAADDPQARLRQLDQFLEVDARPIELLTDRGAVVMRVHPRAVSFAFTPTDQAATPPPVLCIASSSGAQSLPWTWSAQHGVFVARLAHDLLASAFAAEIGAERTFQAMVAASPHWC